MASEPPPKTPEDSTMSAGGTLIFLGAIVLVMDLFNFQLLILSWLGSLQVPLAWGAIVLGVVLIAMRRMQGVPFSAMSDFDSNRKPKKGATPEMPTVPAPPAAPVPNVLSGPSIPPTASEPAPKPAP